MITTHLIRRVASLLRNENSGHGVPGLRDRRRGGVYVSVLGVSMIVAVIAVGAIAVRRVERRMTAATADMMSARLFAVAGIEMGQLRIQDDRYWRSTYSSGVWEAGVSIGTGSYSLDGIDPVDADLTDDVLDQLDLIGTGVSGAARQKVAVSLQPEIVALSCLEVAAIGNNVVFDRAIVSCDQTIATNGTMDAKRGSTITGDVEAVETITGSTYAGTQTEGVRPRELPDADLFDYYKSNGTSILFSSLDFGAIQSVLLSPNSNPFWPHRTNAQGIYYIRCFGQDVNVTNCRIVGTLVLLDAGPGTKVDRTVNWVAAVANYPVLLVRGSVKLRHDANTMLHETAGTGSYNPVGTPYNGEEDADHDDVYPSVIQGLIYASGNVTIEKTPTVASGVIVSGGNLTITDDLTLSYQQIYRDNPPPGFETTKLNVIPGTWRQVVD